MDGIYLRQSLDREFENVAILVAISGNKNGYREVLVAGDGLKEDKSIWVIYSSGCAAAVCLESNLLLGISVWVCWRLWEKYSPKPGTKGVRSLLPPCVLGDISLQSEFGSQDAQSNPRLGNPESRLGEY